MPFVVWATQSVTKVPTYSSFPGNLCSSSWYWGLWDLLNPHLTRCAEVIEKLYRFWHWVLKLRSCSPSLPGPRPSSRFQPSGLTGHSQCSLENRCTSDIAKSGPPGHTIQLGQLWVSFRSFCLLSICTTRVELYLFTVWHPRSDSWE